MKVGELLLCKKNKLIIQPNKGYYIKILKKGKYYPISNLNISTLVCIRHGSGKYDIILFHQYDDAYGYESIWTYFYTTKEMRRIKLKRLELL